MFDNDTRPAPSAEPEAVPLELLEAQICQWAAHLNAAGFVWLQLIAEYDRRRGHEQWGLPSCAHWLAWKCGLAPSAARERVRVARAVAILPGVGAAFRDGTLSYSKVRAITRVADPDTEADLVALALEATASQLDRIIGAWRRVLAHDQLDRAACQHDQRQLSYDYDHDGSLVGRFRIRADDAPAFIASIDEHMPKRPSKDERSSGIEVPTIAQRRADALVEMADAAAGNLCRSASERVTAFIEVDTDVLAADATGKCRLQSGGPLAAETARRLTCDCTEVIVQSTPDAGDTANEMPPSRSIPRAVRRALRRRDDGRCRFPGCETARWVDADHIIHRSRGGANELSNLVTLCRRHHHLVHEGGFDCSGTADGDALHFHRPDGRRIAATQLPPGRADRLLLANRRRGLQLDGKSLAGGNGGRLDLELTVWTIGCNRQARRYNGAPNAPTPCAPAEAPSVVTKPTAQSPPI